MITINHTDFMELFTWHKHP